MSQVTGSRLPVLGCVSRNDPHPCQSFQTTRMRVGAVKERFIIAYSRIISNFAKLMHFGDR